MATFTIKSEGVAQLVESFALDGKESPRKAEQAVRKAALEIERSAKRRAPVDTGFLRSSISTGFEGEVLRGGFMAEVGPGARYGIFVELGTHRAAPHPFLGPAFDKVEPSFIAAMQAIGPLGGR